MKFWWAVGGVFLAVFVVTISFIQTGPSDHTAVAPPAPPPSAPVSPQPIVIEPVQPAPPPAPSSAWEVQEDPAIHTRRIAGGMTLAAVKARMPNYQTVQFRDVWVVDVLEGPVTATAVCGEVASPADGEPVSFQMFVAAGTSVTLESAETFQRLYDRFCAPERRIIPIRYGEFEAGGWKGAEASAE